MLFVQILSTLDQTCSKFVKFGPNMSKWKKTCLNWKNLSKWNKRWTHCQYFETLNPKAFSGYLQLKVLLHWPLTVCANVHSIWSKVMPPRALIIMISKIVSLIRSAYTRKAFRLCINVILRTFPDEGLEKKNVF